MDELRKQNGKIQFTEREMEILSLVALGKTNREIAEHLFIAFETVKWYLKQIYSKLQASNRTEAITVARRKGLLDEADIYSVSSQHNLPWQSTSFVGRKDELSRVENYLTESTCRLLTIVGSGGIGKTRLAIEVAKALRSRFPDGIYLIALAPVPAPNLVPTAIAETLQLSVVPGQAVKDQVINYLRDRKMLLILDNMEHLLSSVLLIPEILQSSTGIKILVTSRERLQLQNEIVLRLKGFDVTHSETTKTVIDSSAAQLFVQCARRVKPSFELRPDTLDAFLTICKLVHGLPLGILLAASWIEMLSVAEIAQEIKRSYEFLEADWRDLPYRQQSLRAVFEQSWNLLTEIEQSAMRSLSVFRGGFTYKAANQVASVSLKTLKTLVNKSVLIREASDHFDMHELLQQFSASKLDQNNDEYNSIRTRHTHYYSDFMDARWLSIRSATMQSVVAEIDAEFGNIRVAWEHIVDQRLFSQLHKMARVLWYFLMTRARYDEGIELYKRAVDTLRPLPSDEARDISLGEALHSLGFFFTATGRPTVGKQLTEESLIILQAHHAHEIIVRASITLCRSDFFLGKYDEMKRHTRNGMVAAEHISDPWYMGPCLFLLGIAEIHLNNYGEALQAGNAALHYLEESGDAYYQGLCLSLVLGQSALQMDYFEDAKQFYLRSLTYFESIQDEFEIAQAKRDLSEVYAYNKEFQAAKQAYKQSLRYYVHVGQTAFIISNLRVISKIIELQSEYERAIELLALIENHPETLPMDLQQAQIALEQLRDQVPEHDFTLAYNCGKILNMTDVVTSILNDD